MEMLLFWPVLGALIGAAAAQKNGFSMVGGVLGGFLLGPLAVLMFFMSGIFSTKEQRTKCPHCAEWINPEARVCPHCQRDVKPPTNATCKACGAPFTLPPPALGHLARCPACNKMTPTDPASATPPA